MPDADVDRLDAIASPHGHADALAVMRKRRRRSAFGARRAMRADQQALGAAEAGAVDEQSYVAGEPEPPRMRKALSVEQERVRFAAKFLQNGQDRRRLAKRKQTRHVGEANGAADHVLLNHRLSRDIPHDDAGHTPTESACRLSSVGQKRQIDPGQ